MTAGSNDGWGRSFTLMAMVAMIRCRRILLLLFATTTLATCGCGQKGTQSSDAPILPPALEPALGHTSATASADDLREKSQQAVTNRVVNAKSTAIDVSNVHVRLTPADQIARKQDAHADDWDSEQTAQQVDAQMASLARHLSNMAKNSPPAADVELSELEGLATPNFRCGNLRPLPLTSTHLPGEFTVRREQAHDGERAELSGARGLGQALKQLIGIEAVEVNVKAKFKLIHIDANHVDANHSEIETRSFYESTIHSPQQTVQQSALWECHWQRPPDAGGTLRLTSIEVTKFEEVEIANEPAALFSDCTASVLGDTEAYQLQVRRGLPYWSQRISREFISELGLHGLAVGDVNGDGLDDLYVCDAGGLPNRLYVQEPGGTAREVAAESGVDLLEESVSALLVDLDNDGDQDLVIATDPIVQIAENDGLGRFTLRSGFYADTDTFSLSAVDYDNDRDLDIYICGYNARRPDPSGSELPFPLPYHDANNGGRNILLANEGKLTFTDVTKRVGLDESNSRFSLAAAWEDYDNDGDVDLYVANDFGRNCLYQNNGGKFTNVAAAAGVEDQASGMSVSWGDYDRDGWMDLYISNMFSAAGNRVTYQRQFKEGPAGDDVAGLRRMARGNSLFRNNGDGTFRDVSEEADVTMGRWAWGSRFVDFNNDGWQDLVVANGYMTNDDTGDL
ncbi:MAG: FG-GAP repeat domain-containing protein [Aeoliella sp.]